MTFSTLTLMSEYHRSLVANFNLPENKLHTHLVITSHYPQIRWATTNMLSLYIDLFCVFHLHIL